MTTYVHFNDRKIVARDTGDRLQKTYTSPVAMESDIKKMKADGWTVAAKIRNPEGTYAVVYVK